MINFTRPWAGTFPGDGGTGMVQGDSVIIGTTDIGHFSWLVTKDQGTISNLSVAVYFSIDNGVTFNSTALSTLTSATAGSNSAHNVVSCATHLKVQVDTLTGTGTPKVSIRLFGRAL